MVNFQNKYRTAFVRMQHWDYRWAGAYFITICTQNREHYFGKIINKQMQLSHTGVIADILWHHIPQHAKNVELGAFVVMPDHLHGILIISQNDTDNENVDDGNELGTAVGTGHALSQRHGPSRQSESKTIGQRRFQNIGKNSLSSIVGSYKSAVSKHAHRLGFVFNWQTRFYDHIIRNKISFHNISNYINANPANWSGDGLSNSASEC